MAVKSVFKPKHYSSLEREIELNDESRKRKTPKARKAHEFKVDFRPPPSDLSLRLTKDEILDKVLLNIKPGLKIKSSDLAERIWPNMTGRDPRWPSVHPYASQVTMALKGVKGAKRDKNTGVWIIV